LAEPPTRPPVAWEALRRFTQARVALGRAGNGLPTAAHLAFQAAHALARDAVSATLDSAAMARDLAGLGLAVSQARSLAPDRRAYLLRPDLGRAAHPDDLAALPRGGASRSSSPMVSRPPPPSAMPPRCSPRRCRGSPRSGQHRPAR
jgi:ethanolamine ammonia-lyase small subunit